MFEYLPILFVLFLGAFIAAAAMICGKLLSTASKTTESKLMPYECGVDTFGNARIQFKIGYYLFALLFLVFDIEALFLFPIAVNIRRIFAGEEVLITPGLVAVDLAIFVAILFCGLIYAWKRGYLKWE